MKKTMWKNYQSDDPELENIMRGKLDEVKKELQETNSLASSKQEIASISKEEQLIFWNHLNEVQIGSFNPLKLTKLNNWVITGDGAWLIQKNRAGYFGCQKSKTSPIPTLPKGVIAQEAFFELTHGKIPNLILQQIVTFFRQVMNKHSNGEAFLQIYWDLQEQKYIIHVPKQNVSQTSVKYDATENLDRKEPERYVFVYECHSHNSMNAFWSGTDNADEKELRVFGVFGNLNKVEYATKHRFFVGEEEIDVAIDGIFEMPEAAEQKSVVTLNKQEYLVSNTSLLFDDKPRYIFKDKDGNVAYIPVDQVRSWQPVIDIPETWIGNINKYVAPEKEIKSFSSNQFNKVFGNKKRKDKQEKGKSFYQKYEYDAIDDSMYAKGHFNGNRWVPEDDVYDVDAEERAYLEMLQEADFVLEEAIDTLSDHTNGFEDLGMTQLVLEAMDRRMLLFPFLKTAKAYLGEFDSTAML